MDFSLSDEQRLLVETARRFVRSELMPLEKELEEKRALDIYRRALSIHPRLPRVPDLIKSLTEKVEGRDI